MGMTREKAVAVQEAMVPTNSFTCTVRDTMGRAMSFDGDIRVARALAEAPAVVDYWRGECERVEQRVSRVELLATVGRWIMLRAKKLLQGQHDAESKSVCDSINGYVTGAYKHPGTACAYCDEFVEGGIEEIAAHIADCPKHPMAALRQRCERLEGLLNPDNQDSVIWPPELLRTWATVVNRDGRTDMAIELRRMAKNIDAALAGQAGEGEGE